MCASLLQPLGIWRALLLLLVCAGCTPEPSQASPTSEAGVEDAGSPAPAPAVDAALHVPANEGGLPISDGGPETGAPNHVDADASAAPPTSALFPAPGAEGACVDAPLRIRFSAPPQLGNTGRLRVTETGNSAAAAEIDMGQALVSEVIDGVPLNLPRHAYADGNDAVFYLPHGALAPGRSYSVTLERGVVAAADGSPFTLTEAWSFRTATLGARPAGSWSVALDGSGDFCTLQGAIDAVPAGNSAPLTIQLAPGTYHEVVRWHAKHQLTIKGAARELVTISGVNNEKLNSGTAKRALIGVDDSRGISIEDLTIRNLTPQDGSQAEALRMQSCDQCSVRRVNVHSLQDTLLWSGRIYARDCYIEGNVDYVWGTGAAYFDHCELHTAGRKGYIVQARNPASSYGYVFVDCRLTGDPGIRGDILARIDVSAYPASQVAFIGSEMGSHIDPSGWLVSGGGATQSLRFSEYGSTQPGGAALDLSKRLPSATPLTVDQAAALRDPGTVLRGWTPN